MYTVDEINKILDYKDRLGQRINVFSLRGAISITDTEPNTGWITLAENSICFMLSDFEDCTTEEEVRDTAEELLWNSIKRNLLNYP